MADKDQLKVLKQGVDAWNKWRGRCLDVRPDLTEANLSDEDLKGANFSQADLKGVNLSYVDLRGANFSFANLSVADLCEANLRHAYLKAANLDAAHLGRADLRGANLDSANLSNAYLGATNINQATIGYTIFGNVDLSTARDLESVRHSGPSTIGIDTIYKSRGSIPEAFLRGCGFTELQIELTKLARPNSSSAEITDIGYRLIELRSDQKPLEFYSCFISYSHQDEAFTKQLHARMQKEKLRTWYAPEDVRGGRKLYEQIDQALSLQDKFLIVLSENSMQSEWVKTELYKARQREVEENCRMLFPVGLVDYEAIRKWQCFDADTGRNLAREVREYYVPDFQNWQNRSSFEKEFQRLLRDLRVEDDDMSPSGAE